MSDLRPLSAAAFASISPELAVAGGQEAECCRPDEHALHTFEAGIAEEDLDSLSINSGTSIRIRVPCPSRLEICILKSPP